MTSTLFPKETEEMLHHFAYGCYRAGQFQKAIDTFRVLAMFRPNSDIYWYSLGSSLMLSGNDTEAKHAFQIASVNCPNDPRPLAYWAECSARLGLCDEARQMIEQAELKVKENEKFSAFQEQIDVIKERLIEVNNESRLT